MLNHDQHTQRVTAHKTPGGWQITLTDAAWADLMTALSTAMTHTERAGDAQWTARFQALRTALNHDHAPGQGRP